MLKRQRFQIDHIHTAIVFYYALLQIMSAETQQKCIKRAELLAAHMDPSKAA